MRKIDRIKGEVWKRTVLTLNEVDEQDLG